MAECRAKGLKTASMQGVNRTLSVVLSQVVEDEFLPANPAFRMGKYLRTGDELPPEKQPLSREEVIKLLEKCEELFPAYYPMFLCALRTGVRVGELVEIKWSDVDFAGRRIHIQRSMVRRKVTSTKTKHNRRVDMSLQLTETLSRLSTARREAALKSGNPVSEWVFVTPTGSRVDPDNLRRRVWEPLLKAAGLRHVRLHDLRHSYASLLIGHDQSLTYISRQMGHSSIKVTVDVYGHLLPNADRSAVDKLDAQPICNPGATSADQAVGASAVSD
jgi:integrase